MKPVFVDTSYLIALAVRSDGLHEAALAAKPAHGTSLVTTDLVVVEVLDALAAPPRRAGAVAMVNMLRGSPLVQVVSTSGDLLRRGVGLYTQRPDKAWGLTDCVSFVVMSDMAISDALTADRHFEQAGFKALLSERAFG